jgi:photosystem II stability/assembly factor-like uncharacterized protein
MTKVVAARRALVAIALAGLIAAGLAALPDAQRPAEARRDARPGPVVAHYEGGVKAPVAKLPRAVNLPTRGFDSAEPTLGFTSDGSAFYAAADLDGYGGPVPNQVKVIKSTDEGRSWADVSPALGPNRRHVVTLDPYVYVDEWTDRVFTIDLTVACSLLSFSDDGGANWTTNPLACGIPVNDHQTLFSGPPATSTPTGYDNVVYYCFNNIASSTCTKSLDGGVTFVPTGAPAYEGVDVSEGGSGGLCGGLHGHGVVDKDGTVYLPREYCGAPFLAISKDEGLSWTRVRVSGKRASDGPDPSVAVDSKGNIYYAFIGRDFMPYVVYSRDGGESWSRPIMVGPPGIKEVNLLTIDAEAPGRIALAYMGSDNVKVTKQKGQEEPARDYAKATWNGYVAMSVNLFDRRPLFYTGMINHPSDPLKRQRCGPGRCGRVFDFIDVEIAPDGTPYGAFTDACIDLCATQGLSDMGDAGLVGRLVGGPSLLR